MKPTAFLRRFLAIAGSAALTAPLANAATLYWDIDSSTAGSGGATPSGTWSTGGTTWSTDSTGATATAAYTTTVFDDLFFSAAADATGAYAVGLNSSTQSARLVTFEDGTVTLSSGTGTLSLGTGGGLTVTSGTTTGATISTNLTLSGAQTFNVAASRTLTLDTGTFTRNAGATLNVASTGTVTTTMTNLASGSLVNGIIGPWASFGSGASTRYATIDVSNNIVTYTGGTAAATAANVTSTLGTVNYDVAAVGTLGAGANINTLRYTGAAGTIAGGLTTKGIMNVSGNALTFSGAVTGSGELVVNTANGDITFNAANAAGSYGLVKTGSGRLTTANIDTTYSGTVTVNGGVLQYGDTLGRLTTGNITLNGGVIEQRWTATNTRVQGSGAGQIQILGGESGFSENGSTGLSWDIGAVTWGSATFNPSKFVLQTSASQGTSSMDFKSAINLNGANRTIIANAGASGTATSTISGVISNSTGTAGLIKEGAGLLNLSVANTYNGGTTVSAGTLSASTSATRLGSNVVGNDISVSAGARLLLTNSANVGNNQTITLNNTGGSLSVLGLGYVGLPSAPITFGSSTGVLAINTTGYNTNLTSTLSGNSVFLGSTGTGTFSGGAATIAAGSGSLYRLGGGGGTITFSAANAITGANAVQIGSTATNGTGTVVFSASQDFTGGATINSGSGLTLGVSQGFSGGVAVNNGGILTVNSTQAFAGGVTLASGGQIFVNPGISGAAFGTGDLTINGGRIDIAASSGTSGGTATTTNNNTWNASWTMGRGSTGTANWNNNGNITLGNNITVTSANNFTNLNLGGVIDDGVSSFGLTFNLSACTATLSNANTYNGATSVSAGALTLQHINAIQNSSGLGMVSGTTLNLRSDTAATFATPLTTLSTTGTASMTLDVNRVSSGTGNQLILNGGLFVSNAHGNVTTLNFTGGNSYTLSIPTLRLEASSSGGGGGGLTLNPTTTSVAIGAMNMPVSNKVQLLTLGGTSSGNTMGAINNTSGQTLSLAKSGTSTWSLTGASNYTGAVTITGGVLRIANNTALGTTAGGVTQSGTSELAIDGSGGAVTVGAEALSINGGGNSNAGALRNIAGNNTYGGTVTLAAQSRINSDSGTLLLNNATSVTGAAQNLLVGGAGNVTISGAITTTTGFILKDGLGTLTLSGTNTYTGATTIQSGSLVAGANAPASGNGAFGGSAGGALVLGNGSTGAGGAPALLINGAYTVGRAITVGSVANTAAYNATIGGSNTSGTSTFSGNITLNTTAANYTATLQAATGGTVDFTTGTWTTNDKAIAIGSSGNTGTVRLSNAISTSGGISVNFGTLELNSAFTSGDMTVASGSTLKGTGSVAGATGVTSATINGTGLVLTGATTFNSTGNTLSGTVTSTAGVSLAGSAALDNSATVTGGIAVGAGTLTGTGGSFSAASTLNGGTINLTSGSFGSTLTVTGGNWNGSGTVSGVVSSTSGTFTIGSGANLSATSGVTATGGAVVINGTLTGALNANSSTTISGTGSVTGDAIIQGTHNPGNSPGIQPYAANLTYSGGLSVVNWELADNTVTNSPVVFDQITVGGNLDFTDLTTLNLIFNGLGSATLWGNSLWDTNQSWTLYDVAGTTTGFSNLSLTTMNWADSGGILFDVARPNGSFSLSQSGQDILINYTIIPEPGAAFIGSLGMLALLRRRRS